MSIGESRRGMAASTALLRTEKLTKDYGSVRALDRLDLEVGPGEIVGLLGPNGSGKSTALRLLMGFLKPSAGHAWIAGHDCWLASHKVREQVGYLPGELRLYEIMTGRQLVRFLSALRQTPEPAAIERLARTFDIDLSRPIGQLSSGMKRKVALLEVLLPHTPLLILDEPTNTLDPTMRDQLLDQLVVARDGGQAVLFSSHVLAEVERVCDRVIILRQGRLVHAQPLAEVRSVKRIEATFTNAPPPTVSLPASRLLDRHDHHLSFEYAGPLPELFAWLATHAVVDVKVEPLGLAGIYHEYHGSET
jgi:ABC-2 type transport system ATP-binding protein